MLTVTLPDIECLLFSQERMGKWPITIARRRSKDTIAQHPDFQAAAGIPLHRGQLVNYA